MRTGYRTLLMTRLKTQQQTHVMSCHVLYTMQWGVGVDGGRLELGG